MLVKYYSLLQLTFCLFRKRSEQPVVGGRETRAELAFQPAIDSQRVTSAARFSDFLGRLSASRFRSADPSAKSPALPPSFGGCQRSQPQFQFEFEHQSAAAGPGPHGPSADVSHQLTPRHQQQMLADSPECGTRDSPAATAAAAAAAAAADSATAAAAARKHQQQQRQP